MQDEAKDAADRVRKTQAAQRKTHEVEFSFLLTELQTGHTLAAVGLAAADTDTADRIRQKARAAYDSVLRFMERVPLTQEQSREINTRLTSLRKRLDELGG
jgi:hypothetical protein